MWLCFVAAYDLGEGNDRIEGGNEMSEHNAPFAWLERTGAEDLPFSIQESCSIGRAPSNDIILNNANVSRHHALLHTQDGKNFYLIDLGSKNGTYLNGRRVQQPCLVRDHGEISIGPFCFHFRQPSKQARTRKKTSTVAQGTLLEIKTCHCWLLVGDLVNSTQLARQIGHDEAVQRTGDWLSTCKSLIEANGGILNKFLGDGFIAYWPDPELQRQNQIVNVLEQLNQARNADHPAFRIILHFGEVSMGGGASLGEENLCGQEVIFAFRMEKLAGSLGIPCMISEAAQSRLTPTTPTLEAGRHPVSGFDGEHLFFHYHFALENQTTPSVPQAQVH